MGCSRVGFARLLPGLALLGLIAGCVGVDKRALQKLACEQAAATIDMQSVATVDALRKALGVAPDVDPIQHCRSLGAAMTPPASGSGSGTQPAAEAGAPEAAAGLAGRGDRAGQNGGNEKEDGEN
ncbi:MAG: hypothetical protein ACKOXO_11145 [Cyanobium sp.]